MSSLILVHTGIGACGFNRYGRGMDESWVNHGLASVGGYLADKSYTFKYLDLRKFKDWKHFSKVVKALCPEYVGISATTVDFGVALKSAKSVKEVCPRARIVVGGIHASVCPEDGLKDGLFDHIVIGEGELVFPDIIEGRRKERIIQGAFIPNLDDLPYIPRRIFGREETPLYPRFFPKPFATFIASRGCPYNCSFCQPAERIVFGKQVRSRSPANLVGEIERVIKDMTIGSYLIHDDCVLWDVEWVDEFSATLSSKEIRLPFAMQSRADLICKNPQLIKSLASVGLRMLLIGFESGSQRILNFLRKGTTVGQNFEAARICRHNQVAIWANYMFGIPGESEQDVLNTVDMIRKIRPEVCSPSFFTPYPGCDLSIYCNKRGLSLVRNYEDFRRNPQGQKIKGIDYDRLKKAVRMSKNETSLLSSLRSIKHKISKTLAF